MPYFSPGLALFLLEFFLEKTFKPPRGDHDERLGFEFSARFG
jgi:hypothetical protein